MHDKLSSRPARIRTRSSKSTGARGIVLGDKVHFSGIPLRALADGRLTDRDYRILGIVAGYDRMSSVRGGQGCWASLKTMAGQVGGEGADYTRFSGSISKL